MVALGTLRKLEGLHTIETIMETLHLTRQSAINLVSKLQREQYATIRFGGGNKKRMYNITLRKQRPRQPGMFDILNKYSPHMKIAPWFDHQVHGEYTVEDAIVDAVQLKSFRLMLAVLPAFRNIYQWKKLYQRAQAQGCWRQVGALYEVARQEWKTPRMPRKYFGKSKEKVISLLRDYTTKEEKYLPIEKRWKVRIPFRNGDILKVKYDLA